jgi:predicted acetyltransferase
MTVTHRTPDKTSTGTGLRLRPLRLDDEAAVLSAHESLALDEFTFALHYLPPMRWSTYLIRLDRMRTGIEMPKGFVQDTFLVAEVDGELVGRASIRHSLNDYLLRFGGHIGYAVLPQHRRRGYATEMLRQSVIIARSVGVDRVLVTCDETNTGSATIIERAGGVFESLEYEKPGGAAKRRYWID